MCSVMWPKQPSKDIMYIETYHLKRFITFSLFSVMYMHIILNYYMHSESTVCQCYNCVLCYEISLVYN